jgi:hypothetical protein
MKQAVCWLPVKLTLQPCSPETSVDFQQTIWYYIPEDRNLQVVILTCLLEVICRLIYFLSIYRLFLSFGNLPLLEALCVMSGGFW